MVAPREEGQTMARKVKADYPAVPDDQLVLNLPQAARLVGVSVDTLVKRIGVGEIAATIVASGVGKGGRTWQRWAISRAEVDRYVREIAERAEHDRRTVLADAEIRGMVGGSKEQRPGSNVRAVATREAARAAGTSLADELDGGAS
jgi:hypothetical protein